MIPPDSSCPSIAIAPVHLLQAAIVDRPFTGLSSSGLAGSKRRVVRRRHDTTIGCDITSTRLHTPSPHIPGNCTLFENFNRKQQSIARSTGDLDLRARPCHKVLHGCSIAQRRLLWRAPPAAPCCGHTARHGGHHGRRGTPCHRCVLSARSSWPAEA